jgi:hypothetical protein
MRRELKKDKQKLAEVLGYDFVPAVHSPLWSQFFQYDDHKAWAKQSDIAKVLILWPRGHYKTTAVVVDIIQAILNFPDIRILIMRGSIAITKAWLNEIRAHFTGTNPNSHLADFFPEFCTEGDLGNSMSFTVPARRNMGLAQATVTVASPNSIKTGTHYDIGFFDDLVNDQNYRSKIKLARVQQDFFACMPLMDAPFYAIMTGTRYAFGDVYENIMRANIKGEWRVSFRTCWADAEQLTPLFPQQEVNRTTILEDGSVVDKKLIGFTKAQLDFMRDSDPEMFASQYLNQPMQKGGQKFTKALLESCRVKKADVLKLSPKVFFVDLASTNSDTADDSCIIIGAHDLQMTQYVVEARGGQWPSSLLAEQIILAALEYRPVTIYFEKSSSAIFFMDYLRLVASEKKVFLPLEFLKLDVRKDAKYTRIGSLQGLMSGRRLRFFDTVTAWDKIAAQFEIFPGGKHKHDDYIDTIALFATHMIGTMIAQPIKPKVNPIFEMVRQQEAVTLADQILERQKIAADPSDGFDAFNSDWSAAQGSFGIID